MNKERWKEIGLPTLSLTVILTVTVLLLVVANRFTAKNEDNGDFLFAPEQYAKVYQSDTRKLVFLPQGTATDNDQKDATVLEIVDAGKGRYIITVSAKGYSSTPVQMLVGISRKNAVDGLSVAVCDETQGLGANIQKDKFLSRFKKQNGPFTLGKNVDGLAGATYSSKAAVRCVNAALKAYEALVEQN